MKKTSNFYLGLLFIIGLLLSQFFVVTPTYAISTAKLTTNNLSLVRTNGITSDITVGQVPAGVTINSGGSSIAAANSAKISFTSDDGSENDYAFRDVFTNRGVSATLPVITTYIDDTVPNEGISLTHLLALQNTYGYEVGSHTYSHPFLTDLTTLVDIDYQLTQSYNVMTSMGLKISNVFIPYGAYDDTILAECQKYYRATRTSEAGVNTPLDKTFLKSYWLDDPDIGITLAAAKQLVDTAAANNQFIIFGFHAGDDTRAFMDNTVGALIDYIHSFNNTQVLTVNKALDRIENVMTQGVDYKIVSGNIVLDKYFVRSLPLGDNVLTFSFSDGTLESMTISIVKTAPVATVDSINVTTLPTKLTYIEGENLNLAGMVVTAHYSNNTNAAVTGYTNSGYTSTVGTKTITIGYQGKTTTFTVTVNPAPVVLDSIAVSTLPTKVTYLVGENLNLSGMVVTAHYSNNTTAPVTGYTNSGYTSTVGTKTITITYQAKTTTFTVTVNPVPVVLNSIAVSTLPTKLTYIEGESFNPAGMVVTAHYSNSTTAAITDYATSGYTATPGVKTITITYQGKTTTFTVTVNTAPVPVVDSIAITTLPTKLTYIVGESFNPTGMVVTAHYSNNTTAAVASYATSGFTSTVGTKTITITYMGKTATFTVTVNPVSTLATPAGLGANSVSYNSIRLTWNPVTDASGYNVYRSLSENGPYTLIASKTGTALTNSGLVTGTNYYYKVSAYGYVGTTKVTSPQSSAIQIIPVPKVPTNFTVTRYNYNTNLIKWYFVTGATGYEVYRSSTLTGTYSLLTSTANISYKDSRLPANSAYYYKVRAYKTVNSVRIYSNFTIAKSNR